MTRFHAPEGHTGGQYTPRYEHENTGQTGQVAENIILEVARETPGRNIHHATLQEDENHGVDFIVEDLKLGQVKIQFKAQELRFDQVKEILLGGVTPIGIKSDVVLSSNPKGMHYLEEARDYSKEEFWAQYDALAPLAQEVRFGGKVDDARIHEAIDKANGSASSSHYEGPQSFSPN